MAMISAETTLYKRQRRLSLKNTVSSRQIPITEWVDENSEEHKELMRQYRSCLKEAMTSDNPNVRIMKPVLEDKYVPVTVQAASIINIS